jgi:hypothetical protein
MAFEFSRFRKVGTDSLEQEQRLYALSGYALYVGQALKVTAGALAPASTVGDRVYAISNVSAASSVVTAAYMPKVFPVNDNQIWKAPFSTAVTAAILANATVDLGSASNGTGIRGDAVGTGAYLYDLITATTPTSAAFIVFVPVP